MSDLRSRGTRAQTQIKEHQTKVNKKKRKKEEMGKGQLGKGGGSNKYKSPNFKALMMIKKVTLKSKQMTTTKLAELSIATRPTVQKN